jgi:predicted ferric reductase
VKKIGAISLWGLLLFGLVAFWLWNSVFSPAGNLFATDPGGCLLAFGRLAGLLAVFCVLLQLILIGRVKPVESVFGLDHLTRVHHFNGFLIINLLVFHVGLVTWSYALQNEVSSWAQFIDFIVNAEDIPSAVAGAIGFVAVAFISITLVKQRMNYEGWHTVHLLSYVAILLAFGHQFELGGDFTGNALFAGYGYGLYALAGGYLVFYRVLKPLLFFKRHRFQIARVVPETKDVVSIYIRGREMSRFHVEAGQFMILRFLAKGFRWQAHPFSLSGPLHGDSFRVSIKNVGDFTAQVSWLQPGTPVLIDGPHGVFTARKSSRKKVLLIAGGIGITPLRTLADELVRQGKDVILLYANRRPRDVVFRDELESLTKMGRFKVHHIFSDDSEGVGDQGYIDSAYILRHVPDVMEYEVFLCGPPPMMEAVVRSLNELGVLAKSIHYERFSL